MIGRINDHDNMLVESIGMVRQHMIHRDAELRTFAAGVLSGTVTPAQRNQMTEAMLASANLLTELSRHFVEPVKKMTPPPNA